MWHQLQTETSEWVQLILSLLSPPCFIKTLNNNVLSAQFFTAFLETLGWYLMLWSFQPPSKTLSSILGKSNLQFAGMSINLNISTSSLNLMTPDGKQVSGEHFSNRHIFFYVLKFCQILLLTDYSQPSHAIYLLCIRRRSCKLLPNPLLYWSNQCHYPATYL